MRELACTGSFMYAIVFTVHSMRYTAGSAAIAEGYIDKSACV